MFSPNPVPTPPIIGRLRHVTSCGYKEKGVVHVNLHMRSSLGDKRLGLKSDYPLPQTKHWTSRQANLCRFALWEAQGFRHSWRTWMGMCTVPARKHDPQWGESSGVLLETLELISQLQHCLRHYSFLRLVLSLQVAQSQLGSLKEKSKI